MTGALCKLLGTTVACLVSLGALAQVVRDPTTPPPEVSMASPSASSTVGMNGMSVIVRDGKPMLVVGTRLVAAGQKTGPWLVERITETEVWLRDGTTLRKVPRFAGIQRSAPGVQTACPRTPGASKSPRKPAAPASAARPLPTPCDVVQP